VNIGAVLLAAGASHRFGTDNKLLADIGGRPLIRSVAEAITHGGTVSEVVVVTGCDQSLIERALDGLPLRFAHNPNWTAGMGSSIGVGIAAIGSRVQGALIVPGDMPFLTAALLKNLVATFGQSQGAAIVFPTTATGEQRNPVLWPQRFFPLLASLSGPGGAKRLLASFAGFHKPVSVFDEDVFADIDLFTDLETARSKWRMADH
jgi:molybdenum cofactor cytidylyltransferase